MTFTAIQNNHSILKTHVRLSKDKLNRERVTARIVNRGNKKCIAIAIGLDVADVVGMHEGNRVNLYVHKNNRTQFLIKKTDLALDGFQGYKLYCGSTSNFLRFQIVCELPEMYKISQTHIIDYEIGYNETLMIDFEKMKYKE